MASQLTSTATIFLSTLQDTVTPSILDLIRRLDGLASTRKTTTTVAVAIVAYLGFVRALRWRRYNAIHRQYHSRYDAKTGKWNLTPEEARRVMLVSSTYDMPKLLNSALAFALFKTYAIPSISKLLYATRELGSKENVAKRYADTEILISTWVGCPINGFHDLTFKPDEKTPAEDPRAMIALSRVNYLHSRYNISNDDYLYTLSLFIIEPILWAKRYGWRALSPMESQSYFIFWSEIGRRMGIHDIPETLEDLMAWSQAYEQEYMVPAKSNHQVAKLTTGELVEGVPNVLGLRTFVERITVCLVEERVRVAMMQPSQPWYLHAFTSAVLHTSGFVQRWFCLPRISPSFPVNLDLPRDLSAPSHPNVYRSRPWYKPESSGLGYIRDRLLVALGYYSAMPSPRSGGYRLEELGPLHLEKTANEEVVREAARLQGCPMPKLR
ncbi:hypothetical protein CC1G_04766 [Coprinopsis cinerea okayama7|uniref:ER-bound oxygenase mpaB/mpaB'/Rubber oxygenase catalytic domain-containing protein n=1 Tax=Coprinopsis cinerea (strain Okayama-7 / 130 / ATCC MYA-4618 / FGSC 9003) TaxID=240176 RepID=A8P2H4_COPC7|nr:hypothetical protein CC1G_04766 [Coprinopsis cinerea okayama7\|eukprot:XP_001838322.2 hypothetical protein CC1G_04766 [Coprinopsis cinerea okayama7\